MRTIHRDIVSAVLFSKDGKMLQALQDPKGRGTYPGCWAIIGGGVDEGEDKRTALNREFMEETGIDISSYPTEFLTEAEGEAEKTLKDTGERVFCKMKFFTYKVLIDDKNASDIKVILNDEHVQYGWHSFSELKDLKLTPPSVELFTKLGYLQL